MSSLASSVLLSFLSALAYAAGAIAQEQVAVSSPDSAYVPLRRAGWWGALALNGLGALLHVVALAYGPLSLVQPLGALTIVFALPMAALCVGRRAGATAWRGAVMATVGLAGLLSLVGSSGGHSLGTLQRVTVALVTGGAVAALVCAGLAAHRHPAVRSVLLATAAGAAFGMSSVFTKTVAEDWTHGVDSADLPSLAAIAVFAAVGVLLSQASYRGGGLAAPLATLTVANPVLAAAVGILMFGETFRYGDTGGALAVSCGVVAAGGLILLTTERIEHTGTASLPAGVPAPVPAAAAGPRAASAPAARPHTASADAAGPRTVPTTAADSGAVCTTAVDSEAGSAAVRLRAGTAAVVGPPAGSAATPGARSGTAAVAGPPAGSAATPGARSGTAAAARLLGMPEPRGPVTAEGVPGKPVAGAKAEEAPAEPVTGAEAERVPSEPVLLAPEPGRTGEPELAPEAGLVPGPAAALVPGPVGGRAPGPDGSLVEDAGPAPSAPPGGGEEPGGEPAERALPASYTAPPTGLRVRLPALDRHRTRVRS